MHAKLGGGLGREGLYLEGNKLVRDVRSLGLLVVRMGTCRAAWKIYSCVRDGAGEVSICLTGTVSAPLCGCSCEQVHSFQFY